MKPLIALYKAFRGGEWLGASLDAIRGHADGVVVVLSKKSWVGNDQQNNCTEVVEEYQHKHPGWIRAFWLETSHQEEQYRLGLEKIYEAYGDGAAVLIVDADELWEANSLKRLRERIDQNPKAHYFCGQLFTYLRSPLYQVWPKEDNWPVVALQSAKPNQIIKVRFQDRTGGDTVYCDDVRFHHFSYVREGNRSISDKFLATSSQELVGSRGDWMTQIWPRLPFGENLHMTPGFEKCWGEIKVLPQSTISLPGFCREIMRDEMQRWRATVESLSPEDSIIPVPTEHDAEKYAAEFSAIAQDTSLLRTRMKMTYLETIVLHQEAGCGGAILEIGSGSGGSLATMALASVGRLVAVDPFVPYDETGISTVRGVSEGSKELFWETARHYSYATRITHIPLNSDQAAECCADEQFGLVLVDGNHTYEIALNDLRLYWPKVRPGGVLIGHDYSTRFPGVIRAAQDWGVPYSVIPGTSLFIARKDK